MNVFVQEIALLLQNLDSTYAVFPSNAKAIIVEWASKAISKYMAITEKTPKIPS